jgi:hypothetical protein
LDLNRDKLKERIRFIDLNERREIFHEGRPHGLREHVIANGKTREMKFFPDARSDGLIRRVEEDHKVTRKLCFVVWSPKVTMTPN